MRYILVREFDIRAGNVAMYYPESNVLVPSNMDPLSKTPAFKSIAVTLDAGAGDVVRLEHVNSCKLEASANEFCSMIVKNSGGQP